LSRSASTESNDVATMFVAECCQRGEDYKVPGSTLYKSYSDRCKDNGFTPKNAKNAAEDWERLGVQKKRVKGRSWWHGLRVTPVALDDDMKPQEKAG
jgi:phage/plasmid-associated DNA primase